MAEISVDGTGPEKKSSLPEHLMPLPGNRWALWRHVGLRAAGFPACQVLKLSVPECAAMADQVLSAEDEVKRAQNEALELVNQALDALRSSQEGDYWDKCAALLKARRRIKRGKLPELPGDVSAAARAVEAFRSAYVRLNAAQADFDQAFKAAITQVSQAIREVALTPRFQEAIIWQNRRAFHTGIEALLRRSTGTLSRNRKQRGYEEMVANYMQRYCVKNDTIGFFGPVGWAKFIPQGEAVVARPGPGLLATRQVYFEGWCMDVLARTLAKNEALRPWFAPRRTPFIDIDGTLLYRPSKGPARLSAEQAAVLQACDGQRIAKDLVLDLIRTPTTALKSEAEVYRLLEYLCAVGLISWTLEVPFEEVHPERIIRQLLERIGEERLRQSSLGALFELETARSIVARAAGDAEKLDQALGNLEATFTRLTGVASTRSPGKTYAARTLVYEDCRRDVEIGLGPEILQALGPPLSLLLTSARWFTYEAAAAYRKVFRQIYGELVDQSVSPIVELVNFWRRVQPHLFGANVPLVETLLSNLQERWADILAISPGQRRAEYTSEGLRPHVMAAFEAPNPGWQFARYHSPDVLIAADSTEAIRRGRYELVMGELHLGTNTLGVALFLEQHPCPQELFRALELDLPEPRVVPVTPRQWPRVTSRIYPAFLSPRDFRLMFTQDACGVPLSQALPIGALVIEDLGRELVVRTRDGQLHFDIVEVFAEALSTQVVGCFKILRPGCHTPRLTIDRLVVCREAWHIPAHEIEFAQYKVEADCFLAARRWARLHGMPRFVFVKVSVEMKPFYVDFDSPIYVNILAKAVRRSLEVNPNDSSITVTEMLPSPNQVWLPDAKERHYTSELRIIAVDLAAHNSRTTRTQA